MKTTMCESPRQGRQKIVKAVGASLAIADLSGRKFSVTVLSLGHVAVAD